MHRLFGGPRTRDWSGWMLESSTLVALVAHRAGATAALDPLPPDQAALEIERLTRDGWRVVVGVRERLAVCREDADAGTVTYVDDLSERQLQRLAREMKRAGAAPIPPNA